MILEFGSQLHKEQGQTLPYLHYVYQLEAVHLGDLLRL